MRSHLFRQVINPLSLSLRCLHVTASCSANPLPVTGTGPPPSAPIASASQPIERLARQRQQAELLKRGRELRAASKPPNPSTGSALKRRFWENVSVETLPEGYHTIHLDRRPIRRPVTKDVLRIPRSKHHLATAIALEWDSLTSAQQALKIHFIPLTSLASRALDIEMHDAQAAKGERGASLGQTREEIVKTLMRYFETDTLLCWAPERGLYDSPHMPDKPGQQSEGQAGSTQKESLRQQQVRVARDIIGHLTSTVWPGVSIMPVLENENILPTPQPQETRDVIRGWLSGLNAWELAGLERGVLASKSLCIATRLLVDWAETFRDIQGSTQEGKRFGIEEAAQACSLEVNYQTALWGEVEDTHDVEKEDVKRQLGSVVLLVSGTNQ